MKNIKYDIGNLEKIAEMKVACDYSFEALYEGSSYNPNWMAQRDFDDAKYYLSRKEDSKMDIKMKLEDICHNDNEIEEEKARRLLDTLGRLCEECGKYETQLDIFRIIMKKHPELELEDRYLGEVLRLRDKRKKDAEARNTADRKTGMNNAKLRDTIQKAIK